MHVGIANPRWRGKRSRHSRCMRNPQLCVSGKRPIARMRKIQIYIVWPWPSSRYWQCWTTPKGRHTGLIDQRNTIRPHIEQIKWYYVYLSVSSFDYKNMSLLYHELVPTQHNFISNALQPCLFWTPHGIYAYSPHISYRRLDILSSTSPSTTCVSPNKIGSSLHHSRWHEKVIHTQPPFLTTCFRQKDPPYLRYVGIPHEFWTLLVWFDMSQNETECWSYLLRWSLYLNGSKHFY